MRSPISGIDEQGTHSRLATERTTDLSTRITIEGLRRSECETLRQEIIKRIELGHRLISWTVAAAGAFVGLGGTITYRSPSGVRLRALNFGKRVGHLPDAERTSGGQGELQGELINFIRSGRGLFRPSWCELSARP